jgi:hypothetical protein
MQTVLRLAVLATLVALAACATFVVTDGSQTFDTTGLPSTPLTGAALQRVCDACAADPACSDMFGMGSGVNYVLCAFLIQQAQPFPGATYTLEMSVTQALDGQTVDEVIDAQWVRALLIGAHSTFACYNSERYVLDADGTSGKCVPRGDESITTCATEHAWTLVLLAFILAFLFGAFLKFLWDVVHMPLGPGSAKRA